MTEPAPFVTVDDYEPVARAALPPDVYDYFAGGAGDEWTLAENRRAFDRWMLRPRFLRGAGEPDTSTSVLGAPLSFPVMVAPWAYQDLAHADAEVATAPRRRGRRHRHDRLLDRDRPAGADRRRRRDAAWWQLYVFADRGVHRGDAGAGRVGGLSARSAGRSTSRWSGCGTATRAAGSRCRWASRGPIWSYDPQPDWDDLAWIRGRSPGCRILVKGILTAEDAELAVQAGRGRDRRVEPRRPPARFLALRAGRPARGCGAGGGPDPGLDGRWGAARDRRPEGPRAGGRGRPRRSSHRVGPRRRRRGRRRGRAGHPARRSSRTRWRSPAAARVAEIGPSLIAPAPGP